MYNLIGAARRRHGVLKGALNLRIKIFCAYFVHIYIFFLVLVIFLSCKVCKYN